MRLAFYSPLNPVPSGISDYSEELLPLLAREFEIELVVDRELPTNPALADFPVLTRAAFKKRAPTFDLVLYQMGNSPAHALIYETLRRIPGVVVMHDVVLHHLRAWQTLEYRDVAGYIQAMRADYGEAGAELARLEATGQANLNRFDFPLNGEVVRAAGALIVHSAYAARQLQPIAPQTPIAIIPMGVPPAPEISAAETRARLRLPADALIIAAFGEIHPHKRVTVALQAFARFHARFPNSLLLLVGRESPIYSVQELIHLLDLDASVRWIGFAPRAAYEDYIAAADLCLNLRYPTAGETSAALLRLFAAGKPVLVTRTGAFAELPDGVCAKIEADEYEQDLLLAHLELFAQRPDLRAALGANARAFASQCHTLEQSAAAYADFLRAVSRQSAESKSYLVEWTSDRMVKSGETQPEQPIAPVEKIPLANPPQPIENPVPAVPIQTAPPPSEIPNPASSPDPASKDSAAGPSDLRDAVARAYAELGLDADDPVLQAVARELTELGLNGDPEHS